MYLGDPSKSLVDGTEAMREVYKGDRGSPDFADLRFQQAQTTAKSRKKSNLAQQNTLLSQRLDQSLFGSSNVTDASSTAAMLPTNALIVLQWLSALFSQFSGSSQDSRKV